MSAPQPGKLSTTRSFSRLDSSHSNSSKTSRSRASTLSEVHLPGQENSRDTTVAAGASDRPDLFEKKASSTENVEVQASAQPSDLENLPDDFDELPIELISLTDRFVASLSTAKIYSSPPSADKLSELFQEFYTQAESHIATHIQILSTRQYRDASPAPSASSRSSRLNAKTSSHSLKRTESSDSGQKMLTPGEISDRRKARRLLDHKRVALEEAVERRACEGIYDKIWRHRTTLDEEQDEKLRSKTEALAVVGIGLGDLGIELPPTNSEDEKTAQQSVLNEYISKARQGLLEMNQSRNPLGKLQGLASTHQSIVELLTKLHQSSSSADEILPTLIYVLIRSPAENVGAISNLNFIQRFRSSNKINGEAAYCLTNLEAAITFLETVDLATLRDDEASGNRSRDSSAAPAPSKLTDIAESTSKASPLMVPATARPVVVSPTASRSPAASIKEARPTPPASPSHQRRLSSLFQPPAALGAASDAVLSTADESFRNIKGTLDNSFKLLFGRLREQHVKGGTGTDPHGAIIVPKTLDEARRMVSPKAMVDEDGTLSENSSVAELEETPLTPATATAAAPREDRLLDMIAGSRQQAQPRERSADSSGSGTRRVAFLSDAQQQQKQMSGLGVSPPVSAAAAVESMRNFGNSLNPLNRLSGMNVNSMMRGFGRAASSPSAGATTPPASSSSSAAATAGDQELAGASGRIGQPIQRFLDLPDARELRIGDVEALLKDYQRLAQALKLKGLV